MAASNEPLHLVTSEPEDGKPNLGCCDRCGRMCWPGMAGTGQRMTRDRETWEESRDNCVRVYEAA